MSYIEAILALFAIVDPIGNIPILLHIAEHTPNGQSQKAFNTAVAVGVIILLVFSFAGNWVLNRVFHIQLADLQLAGGILLLIIAVDHLVFGSLRRSVMVEGTFSPYEIGCVPLACPLLAGPGAMVTSLTTLEKSGPAKGNSCNRSSLWGTVAYNAVHPAYKQISRQNGLHGIFKGDVPVYCCDWCTYDNVRPAVLFCHP